MMIRAPDQTLPKGKGDREPALRPVVFKRKTPCFRASQQGTEQGISLPEQGIFLPEQGIFLREQVRTSTDAAPLSTPHPAP
jgi:hypothetical protein